MSFPLLLIQRVYKTYFFSTVLFSLFFRNLCCPGDDKAHFTHTHLLLPFVNPHKIVKCIAPKMKSTFFTALTWRKTLRMAFSTFANSKWTIFNIRGALWLQLSLSHNKNEHWRQICQLSLPVVFRNTTGSLVPSTVCHIPDTWKIRLIFTLILAHFRGLILQRWSSFCQRISNDFF